MIKKLFDLVVKGQGDRDIMSVIKLVDALQICIPCNAIQLLPFVEVNIRIYRSKIYDIYQDPYINRNESQ